MEETPVECPLDEKQTQYLVKLFQFIKSVKQFKLEYQKKAEESVQEKQPEDMSNNQNQDGQLMVWQTFILSIQKFNQNPFDMETYIFATFFQHVFLNFRKKKQQITVKEQDPNQQLNNQNIQQEPQKQPIKVQIKDSSKKKKSGFNLSTWMNKSKQFVAKKQLQTMNLDQKKKIIQEINKTNSFFGLQFIVNHYWCFLVIFSTKIERCIDLSLQLHLIQKFQQLKYQKKSSLQQKICQHINRILRISASIQYPTMEKPHPVKMLKIFLELFKTYKDIDQMDLRYYMHILHKTAQKRKHFLMADIIRTKCFYCQAQHYSTHSIQKIRIYQCLSRKISNITSPLLLLQQTQKQKY